MDEKHKAEPHVVTHEEQIQKRRVTQPLGDYGIAIPEMLLAKQNLAIAWPLSWIVPHILPGSRHLRLVRFDSALGRRCSTELAAS